MNLYKEILANMLSKEDLNVVFPNLTLGLNELLELKSYQTLVRIKAVIEDDSLEDSACFMKIEEIVRTFEDIGSSAGTRHDF